MQPRAAAVEGPPERVEDQGRLAVPGAVAHGWEVYASADQDQWARPSGGSAVVCRSFSGHKRANYGREAAQMLGKWPHPNKLSEMPAQAGGLWIRRVLVRAQEGQCPR